MRFVAHRRSISRPLLALAVFSVALAAHAGSVPFVERQRQTRIVEDRPESIVMDEFRWGREQTPEGLECVFQRTTIRPEDVADVYWWSENFPPKWIAAHGQLVFVMKDHAAVEGADGQRAAGVVVSVEAHLRQDQSYNFLVGMLPKRTYGLIYVVTTLRDRVQRATHLFGHSMDMLRLKLSQQQKQDLLRHALRTAARPRPEEAYHTTRRSCITEGLKMLNAVLPEEQRVRLWTIPKLLANLRACYPKTTPGVLIGKGLAEEAGRFDENTRELRLPDGAGGEHVIDLLELPGAGIPKGLRSLEEVLFRFSQEVRGVHLLSRLQDTVRVGSPRFFQVQKELFRAQEAVEEVVDDLLELAATTPGPAVRFLARQERPDVPEVQQLTRLLLRRFRAEIHRGDWTPTPEEQEALEQLAR